MNRMRWLVVMCVCFGLAAGSYLVGCCGDDDGLSCEEAVEQFLSDDCMDEALAVEQDLEDCFGDCPTSGEERVDCTDECLEDFVDATPACGDSGPKLLSEETDCGDCFEDCGVDLVTCLDEGEDADFCLDNVFVCVAICAGIPE